MSFQIRKLTREDITEFFSLRLESLQNAPTNFLSSYDEENNAGQEFYLKNVFNNPTNKNIILGAFNEVSLVGIIGMYSGSRAKVSHQAVIWGMYVKPEYRGKKIAKLLMENAINHAKSKMLCAIIKISAEENNTPALNLYHSFGFELWGIEPRALELNGEFFNEKHMALLLNNTKG